MLEELFLRIMPDMRHCEEEHHKPEYSKSKRNSGLDENNKNIVGVTL